MRPLRRYVALLIPIAGLLLAAGCSSSVSGDSDSITPEVAAASTPQPTVAPTTTPAVEPTAPAAEPTRTPDQPTATPAEATPTATESTQASPAPANPTPAEAAAAPDPTPVPLELFQRGLLQEQFCVTDIVAPDTLNVRSGPSSDEAIVYQLAEGQCRIWLTGDDADGWLPIIVEFPDNLVRGWVSGRYIAPQRAPIDPDATLSVITISLEYLLDSSSPVPLENFRMVNAEGLVVGFLDANGQITVPDNLDLSRSRIEAAFVDDEYCAWTGQLRFEGFDDRYAAELFAVCA